jgi:hypothetical protein
MLISFLQQTTAINVDNVYVETSHCIPVAKYLIDIYQNNP